MDKIANARRLRQEKTDAERKLWSILRGRKLDGWKFRRQVPIDRYFADFACMEARLVIELDGRNKIIGTDLYADDGTNRGACCPDAFTRTRYRWQNGKFRQQGTPEVVFLTDAVPRS